MKVKIFSTDLECKLESKINEWISDQGKNILIKDIKYSSCAASVKDEYEFFEIMYSAMIIYEAA